MIRGLARVRPGRLSTRSRAFAVYGLLLAANFGAWAWAFSAFHAFPILLGTAALAYSFGLRHAFDADHIAAIDNVTRKLMQQGQRPVGVGLYFSLGHSTIVVGLTIAIALTATALQDRFAAFKAFGAVAGTLVSALFLFAIAAANVAVLISVWRSFTAVRRGERFVEEDLDLALAGRGLLARLFRGLFRVVRHSWQMYPIGLLFGLGFDTATEVGLLGVSATQAAQGLSIWSILVFPALFTAGMTLLDTTDSVVMLGRLWLGLRQADPQALLQPDHHRRVGGGGGDRRRIGDAEPDRRPFRPDRSRRLLGGGRGPQRQFRRPRLPRGRRFRLRLAGVGDHLPTQALRRNRDCRALKRGLLIRA